MIRRYRFTRVRLGLGRAAAVSLLWASLCGANVPSEEGAPHFSIFPQIEEAHGPTDPFRVLISMEGTYYPMGTVGRATIHLGPGLEWVSGDSLHVAHVSDWWDGKRDNLWSIVVRTSGLGSTAIRASMRVEMGGNRIDEAVVVLPIEVEESGVRSGIVKVVRRETIRDGQRYRYGGHFLIPIDGPEDFSSDSIVRRAKVLDEEVAICSGCPSEGREVPFVVFINTRGGIHSYRRLSLNGDSGGLTPEMIRAAENALSRWKFSPGSTRAGPVADWIIVRVRVGG